MCVQICRWIICRRAKEGILWHVKVILVSCVLIEISIPINLLQRLLFSCSRSCSKDVSLHLQSMHTHPYLPSPENAIISTPEKPPRHLGQNDHQWRPYHPRTTQERSRPPSHPPTKGNATRPQDDAYQQARTTKACPTDAVDNVAWGLMHKRQAQRTT